MEKVHLLLGIHNHQPVGNFEHVFREAHDRCYRPFLDLLEGQPALRISLHYSGPLLDWLESHQPTFLDQLKKLVERRQVELLTGGHGEPILPAIPERDGIGQIEMMTQHLKRRLGADPKGLWLAERVWEPSLPKLLGSCGVAYTLVDDSHFQLVGIKPGTLRGYYLTEREGTTLGLFPISKRLRYLIPFRQPEETIEYLRQLSEQGPVAITYADDGEKFGLWPGTYRWVHDQGWLKRFLNLLEQNRSWITTTTFSEYIAQTPPTGRIYLPAASYEEMMEWALPTEAIIEREVFLAQLEAKGLLGAAQGFLRGGFWNHFLVKYPEINLMHKKMLYVSEKLSLAEKPGPSNLLVGQTGRLGRQITPRWVPEARKELYQAQGNDAYWHGLFGGYYLNYLRHAVYEHLIKAEKVIDSGPVGFPIRVAEMDLDRDGNKELLAESSCINLYIKPDDGATAIEIDYRPKALCLTHVPMRRPEAYHQRLKLSPPPSGQEQDRIPSIHELASVKEAVLDRKLIYDRYPRWSFRDHLFGSDTTLARLEASEQAELGGFTDQPYKTEAAESDAEKAILSFHRTGLAGNLSLAVKKVYTLSALQAQLTVEYTFHTLQPSPSPLSSPSFRGRGEERVGGQLTTYLWGVELNLTLLAGADPKRYYRFPGKVVEDNGLGSRGTLAKVTEAYLMDEWQGIEIHLKFKPAAQLWRFPVETVSQSEEGMASSYQGSCLVALWPLALPMKGKQRGLIAMKIVER